MEKRKRSEETPGNAIASAEAVTRRLVATSEQLYRAERTFDRLWEELVIIKSVKIRLPTETSPGYLGVVTAEIEGVGYVGFVSEDTFADCARKVIAMLENKSIQWKEDKYGS